MSDVVRLLPALLAVSVAASSLSADETLRMKFHQGETYTYRIVQEMQMEGSAKGQKIESGMDQQLDLNTLIKSVDADGNAKAAQTIERVKMKVTLPAPISRTFEVDTASEEKLTDPNVAAMTANLTQMVGQAISMTIAPDGKISDVSVPEKIKAAQQASGAGGGEGIAQTIKQSGLRLPDGPVAVGQTWDQQTSARLPFGEMKIDTTYTYRGKIENGLHKIDAKMAVTMEPDEKSTLKVTLTAKEANGTFLFDNEAGRLADSTILQVLELDMHGIGKQLVTTHIKTSLVDGTEDDDEKPTTEDSGGKSRSSEKSP